MDMDWSWWRWGSELCLKILRSYTDNNCNKILKLPMAMAFQIIASSSPTITKSHLPPSYKTSKPYLSSCFSLLGSSRFSPYIGLKHMGISISPKSWNPGLEFLYITTKLIPFFCENMFSLCNLLCREEEKM